MQALSDEALVELTLKRLGKDQRPFEELYRRHQAMVWRICQRFMGSPRDAEEVMQETFFRAYRNLAKFQGRSSFKTWIYRIAVNTNHNALKKRMKLLERGATPLEEFSEVLPGSINPEKQLLILEQRSQLAAAFERLKGADMEILRLREIEGLRYTEIAKELGIKLSTAKMRVIRARVALQEAYRQIDAGGV
jgi:RNA polymerase sigma-70 factor (ECF subfamily)